jgi:hypothetical protein
MNQSEQQTQTTPTESDVQLRTWVTPTFEQAPLKDALSGPGASFDGGGGSS